MYVCTLIAAIEQLKRNNTFPAGLCCSAAPWPPTWRRKLPNAWKHMETYSEVRFGSGPKMSKVMKMVI